MASEADNLRALAAELRKEAAVRESQKSLKIASLLQAGQALAVLKGKLNHVR